MKALVLGAGVSGKSATKLLKKLGFSTYLLDDKKQFLLKRLKERIFENLSLMVISPGVCEEHPLVCEAKARGVKVIGELELGARELACPIIAITGTNGKTTTTTLTGELLKGWKNVFVGGNIGVAVSNFCLDAKEEDYAVLEVSSFQLESIDKFRPHIAAILNVTVDHLNRHKTFENYLKAKLRIFENQMPSDFAVINLDDPVLQSLDLSFIKSQIFYFSTKMACKGCYAQGDMVFFNDGEETFRLFNVSEVPLKGEHNLSNTLASVLCSILAGEDKNNLRAKVHNFKGVSHRLEYVTEINGVTFINDSKATNISSTLVAISSMDEPTTLILGGSDKGFEFDELVCNLKSVIKNIVVVGETKEKILLACKRHDISNVFEAESFKEAVYLAYGLSGTGETVLLSPACASFDMFSDYEERGTIFKRIVREIEKSENRKVSSKKRKRLEG